MPLHGDVSSLENEGRPECDQRESDELMPADRLLQMDLSCGIRAAERARGRVVTAAVKEMAFALPVKIGDTLCIYTDIIKVGRTSMTLKVEAWAQRYLSQVMDKVTDAIFVMVALDSSGKPTPVPAEE
ncbi:acyl-CoA thioesterase [Sinorhizobium medicae]|nr:acyl-CoA thioesterase [Sinorhizobium medicae]